MNIDVVKFSSLPQPAAAYHLSRGSCFEFFFVMHVRYLGHRLLLRHFSLRPGVSPVLVLLPLRQKLGDCRLSKTPHSNQHMCSESEADQFVLHMSVFRILGGWKGQEVVGRWIISSLFWFSRVLIVQSLPVSRELCSSVIISIGYCLLQFVDVDCPKRSTQLWTFVCYRNLWCEGWKMQEMSSIFEYPGKALDMFFVVSEHIRSTAVISGLLSIIPKLESALTIHVDVVKFSSLPPPAAADHLSRGSCF